MLNPRKLSKDPVLKNLLDRDRLPVLRSAQDEPNPELRNGTASLETVAAALASRLPRTNPNHSNSLSKAYRYLTTAEVVANGGGGEAFEQLDYSTCCIATQAIIERYVSAPGRTPVYGQVLVAVFDATAPDEHYVYLDGSFTAGTKVPAKFVPIESVEAKHGYVRRDTDPATIVDWQVGELSIWNLSGTDQFATAKQAGGPFPAFTGAEDAYWEPAAPPIKPTADLLTSDNTFTGTNTFSKQVTVFDVLVTSVQNLALNSYSKLAAFVQGLAARLGATTAADPAAPTSKLATPGWGLEQVGSSLGLLRNTNSIPLPAGFVNTYVNTQDGNLFSVSANITTSPLIAVRPKSTMFFTKPVANICSYDSRGVFISGGGVVSGDYEVGADTYFIRFMAKTNSGSDTGRVGVNSVYNEITYKLGNLPYVVGIQTANGVVLPNALGVVDGGAFGGGTGTPGDTSTPGGTSYTDSQARAAQLGRVAPSGTTTITLGAESPSDYGTFSSGTPTIDATNCVVGKCVRFSVGAGANAPAFSNAPSGQPYKFRPENIYLNGVAFSYSLLVCVDKIEIVIAED
jgi:hypothetical protein